MALPILYSFRRCPYAMRARLAVAVSATRCELREVKLSAKPEDMLVASPKGTVPVLIMPDGEVIDQSIDIMRRVLATSDPEGWLDRDAPDLIAANDTRFKHHLDRYKYPERHDADPHAHRTAGLEFLHELEDLLRLNANLAGDARGLADAAVMPFVRQFAAVDRDWFADSGPARVQAWLSQHTTSDLFETVMVRVSPWTPSSTPPITFPC
ncbi:glutathione S-transferase [Novosphingobium guangzhouense]|uniref:Glutathione S-transferase n=1 Tax=Novosphingobium guangzhouense TaxID=1850347 RepID=A0A2K2G6J0_9SPHN|nr:glutathione S-transferase [Novosphingobium guangzhouense]PNU06656.1 glutathione S-transferase [Novosphingobium guangzhouense]